MRIVQLGAMGRDVAAAERFAEHGHEVSTIAEHHNPSLVDISENTGGQYVCVKDMLDTGVIASQVAESGADMFLTNQDDALAAGVVDAVRKANPDLLIPSPDRGSSRIEWDKFYLRDILDDIDPDYNPVYQAATTTEEVREGMKQFKDLGLPVAVKPRGLTGGKGVKVMGPHLETYEQARDYALKILKDPNQSGVLLEEVLEGMEFTLQAYSDGRILASPPATYDYPYREDRDTGPGTGGMGSFTLADGSMPFLSKADAVKAISLMSGVQNRLKDDGHDFKGVFFGSFFATKFGLKFTEVNARAGDPEMMNIINLLEDDVDLAEVLGQISEGQLDPKSVRFKQLASTALYLVSPDYAYGGRGRYIFDVNPQAIAGNDCKHYFASAERSKAERAYETVGTSRTLALVALGQNPWDARAKIDNAIREGVSGDLDYRNDVGREAYIRGLTI